MLTYELKKSPGVPLYEALYRCIRGDILSGVLACGEKLPSKQALAANLEVSKITVETAYNQLLCEGYIRSQEKVGYFVEPVQLRQPPAKPVEAPASAATAQALTDLTANSSPAFPFSVWSRLQREVMLDLDQALLLPMPNRGLFDLRSAIAQHLWDFRGMHVNPEHILIGAGTDFLYNLLIQLLGRDKLYAVEDPGYGKIRKIYAAGGVQCVSIPLDSKGVCPAALKDAQVLHISPSHHFPTGLVTPVSRRRELLQWAQSGADRYIIEDDYDSEFRFDAHPMPAMTSMDTAGRVIYINTFSKSLTPSIRISYMVLPEGLMERFQQQLGFYSCTVPSFEQHTLARFIRTGHFEKHINRMRKAYKTRRNQIISLLQSAPFASRLTILEQDAGLHFLLKADTTLSDEALVQRCRDAGILVRSLSSYYWETAPQHALHCLVVNYSGLQASDLETLSQKLTLL